MSQRGFVIQEPRSEWGDSEDHSLHLVLVNPEIPGNTGNVGRLCAGSNVWLHLVRPLGFELDNKYLRRAGLDYWPHVNLCVHDTLENCLSHFRRENLFLFTKKATTFHVDVDYSPGAVLIFGCETKGLSGTILDEYSDRLIRIPTTDKVRSLNLSNACAIAIYEAMRQLSWTPLTDR